MEIARIIPITDAILVSSTVPEPETLWNTGTYAAGDDVYRVIDGIHQWFISAQNGNASHVPEDDVDFDWWIPQGPTNRWAALDTAMGSVTEGTGSISYVFTLPDSERVSAVYLAGLIGAEVRLQINDPYEGDVYDETVSLSDPGLVLDHFDYCFNDIVRYTELLFTNLSRGAGSTFTVTVQEPGEPVGLGTVVFGFAERIGGTQWGAEITNRDYSTEAENDFGDEVIVRRGYRKLGGLNVIVENRVQDSVIAKLNGLRGVLSLYIGDDRYLSLTYLGRYESYRLAMSMPPDRSVLALNLKSLTTS